MLIFGSRIAFYLKLLKRHNDTEVFGVIVRVAFCPLDRCTVADFLFRRSALPQGHAQEKAQWVWVPCLRGSDRNKGLVSAELSHPRARESPEPSKG